MSKGEQDGSFSADTVYTITELASKMGVSEKLIKDNLIHSRECAYKRRGNTYFFLGKWIINWCLADHEIPGEEPKKDDSSN